MDRGLWRFTRHPNYFGDATLWWGFYLIAAGAGDGWLTIYSPLLMTFILMRVSGVTLLERTLKAHEARIRGLHTPHQRLLPLAAYPVEATLRGRAGLPLPKTGRIRNCHSELAGRGRAVSGGGEESPRLPYRRQLPPRPCYNTIVKNSTNTRPRVVIVGAGFAGLRVARGLRGAPVDVTVLDKHNYHTFIPLLYQVATAGLEPEAIAHPVRRIVTAPNVRFRLASVTGVDLEQRRVITDAGDFPYDYLVLAAGSVTNFFGLESVARHAATLRELDDAETVRDRVLASFEAAAAEKDRARRQALMTTVIVGGGPTGVELAGALAELRRHVLPRDFPELDISHARIILLEASDRLLDAMPERMQHKALQKLREMGVDVQLGARVTDADELGVTLADGSRIDAGAVVWVAGLRASPLAQALNAPLGAGGRVPVSSSLSLPDHPEVYVIGDMAHAGGRDSPPHPMLAPVAIQQGDLVAENILRQSEGKRPRSFKYKDPGTMVTIGRASAVARVYGIPVSGFVAWLLWLTVHIVWLIGFRNRALVLVNWAWNYFTYERGVRLIRRRR